MLLGVAKGVEAILEAIDGGEERGVEDKYGEVRIIDEIGEGAKGRGVDGVGIEGKRSKRRCNKWCAYISDRNEENCMKKWRRNEWCAYIGDKRVA